MVGVGESDTLTIGSHRNNPLLSKLSKYIAGASLIVLLYSVSVAISSEFDKELRQLYNTRDENRTTARRHSMLIDYENSIAQNTERASERDDAIKRRQGLEFRLMKLNIEGGKLQEDIDVVEKKTLVLASRSCRVSL